MRYNLRPRKQNLPGQASPPKPPKKSLPKKLKKAPRSPPVAGVRKITASMRRGPTTESPKETIVDRAETLAALMGADEPRPVTPEDRPPRKRWIHRGEPIHDRALAPKGWTSIEPDLDLEYVSCQTVPPLVERHYRTASMLTFSCSDYEGQIARCHERIADGIMPRIFERKLKEFEGLKANRE